MASILKVDTIQDQDGNNIINESGDTITIGASGDTVNVVGTLQNGGTNFLQGITMADQWRLNASVNTGTNADVTSNWERTDDPSWSGIGTGLTQSSGVFSFPQTGLYFINYRAMFNMDSNDDNLSFQLKVTINNSTYDTISDNGTGNGSSTFGVIGGLANSFLINVTDITNVKFKFSTGGFAAGTFVYGSTNLQRTGFVIFRLGDSQ